MNAQRLRWDFSWLSSKAFLWAAAPAVAAVLATAVVDLLSAALTRPYLTATEDVARGGWTFRCYTAVNPGPGDLRDTFLSFTTDPTALGTNEMAFLPSQECSIAPADSDRCLTMRKQYNVRPIHASQMMRAGASFSLVCAWPTQGKGDPIGNVKLYSDGHEVAASNVASSYRSRFFVCVRYGGIVIGCSILLLLLILVKSAMFAGDDDAAAADASERGLEGALGETGKFVGMRRGSRKAKADVPPAPNGAGPTASSSGPSASRKSGRRNGK